MDSNYYYGLPDILWDNLADQIEEIFREESIGQHILGIFPSGERIFGVESANQEAIVLYINSIEALLDPAPKNTSSLFYQPIIKDSNNKVTFIDLQYWAEGLISICHPKLEIKYSKGQEFISNCIEYLPLFGDTLYLEDSISDIFLAAQEIIKIKRWKHPFESFFDNGTRKILRTRAETLFYKTGEYCPCINHEWGITKYFDIDTPLYELDKKVIEEILFKNGRINQQLEEKYLTELYCYCSNRYRQDFSEEKINQTCLKFRKEVINFYRYQL